VPPNSARNGPGREHLAIAGALGGRFHGFDVCHV
jgi:hypothetical protein